MRLIKVRTLLASALAALFCMGHGLARADMAAITPAKDNTLIEDAEGAVSNGSGPALFAGNNSRNTSRRAVLQFDLAASIPPGSKLNAVELHLYVSGSPTSLLHAFTLHRLLANWGEGASSATGGSGSPSEPEDATWLHTFYPDRFWIEPGGDFETIASATTVVGDFGFFIWSDARMTADAQAWLDHPEANFGWLLRGDETGASTVRLFESRESPDESLRPTLIVDYTPGTTQTSVTTWGQMKSRYRHGNH